MKGDTKQRPLTLEARCVVHLKKPARGALPPVSAGVCVCWVDHFHTTPQNKTNKGRGAGQDSKNLLMKDWLH